MAVGDIAKPVGNSVVTTVPNDAGGVGIAMCDVLDEQPAMSAARSNGVAAAEKFFTTMAFLKLDPQRKKFGNQYNTDLKQI